MQPEIINNPGMFALILVLAAWTLVWKGIALWKSARAGSKVWFVVLLIVNSVGILEILYIYVFSKMGKKENQQTVQ
jgi:hypothetical protein